MKARRDDMHRSVAAFLVHSITDYASSIVQGFISIKKSTEAITHIAKSK